MSIYRSIYMRISVYVTRLQQSPFTDGLYTKGTRAHTHREIIQGGASRASKGQEALCPPVLTARRRRKRQHHLQCPYPALTARRRRKRQHHLQCPYPAVSFLGWGLLVHPPRVNRLQPSRIHRRFIIQRGHEHTRTGNSSESGFGSLRGAPFLLLLF